ncbi:MAG: hypothetical protein CMJ70_16415 [Planctomycetaceae bacterium]|nr:hypothetical protein [Planctomycetaceae bacterium]|tara:strand:+ start:426 stop:3872 length:3447 start_codon:yes stop_codon:yes gene_type:complete
MQPRASWFVIPLVVLGTISRADEKADFFEQRIRPLLTAHCYACHGPDQAMGKLRLDTRVGWQRGGDSGPAIVPGDPASSLLIKAVQYRDPQLKMPPPDEADPLSPRQIADLVHWIREGAVDTRTGKPLPSGPTGKEHWAFQPLTQQQVPAGSHPVDALIDPLLAQRSFVPAPRADRQTLIRRMTYDLLGLPPTAEQRATALADLPGLIDALLASPHYGERWARHWLDVARYADAKDGVLMYGDARIRPFAYTYRDYVIRAFNDDKPFNVFIQEQIAADQLDLAAQDPALAAMGFLTLGRMFDNNRHDVIDDQIDTITRGLLGLTVSCARCHDHKFDPIPTADYYSLYGILASSIEPYDRPRIGPVSEAGKQYEQELGDKLQEVFARRQKHYEETLATARDRTPDYLVQVATTDPDISETSIFFLSLLPEQLRPQITYRWRQLIARRAHPQDPIFGPWADLMENPELQVKRWQERKVDPRVIMALVAAQPQNRADVARTYGTLLRDIWAGERKVQSALQDVAGQLAALSAKRVNLADVVGGGIGHQTDTRGQSIDPVTGEITTRTAGFVEITEHDTLIPVPASAAVDGVFIPKSGSTVISSTGLKISDLPKTGGQTWDYFRYGPSGGATVNTIDGVDYSKTPNSVLALHANKGITFDLNVLRTTFGFQEAAFQAVFGHGGAKGQSTVDFFIYLDGKRVLQREQFAAQQKGLAIDLPLPARARFLTLIVTEGGQGLSHDQAILGNPRIAIANRTAKDKQHTARLADLQQQQQELQDQLAARAALAEDRLGALLLSEQSPVWFPIDQTYHHLSRTEKDAFRGLVNQIDNISVKHKAAADRAMVMVDDAPLYDPVIFQRGDPAQRGNPVPRQFLQVVSPSKRTPFTRGSGRLELANAIASDQNPLTARVWANRVWMHHFGEPLVDNPSDFGLRTTRPVQYQLLDYLAHSLIKSGWRTKALHRLIMTSQAYQRTSDLGQHKRLQFQATKDPENQYLWRAHRRRLDLEQMRDTLLLLSGQLNQEMYGRPGAIDNLDYRRRTIYTFVERQNVPSVVKNFDAANPDSSTARRVTTTVPQQALFAMNAPFVTQAAQAIAKRTGGSDPTEQIRQLYTIILGRTPSSDELNLGLAFIKNAPWEQYAHTLLMTNEAIFID